MNFSGGKIRWGFLVILGIIVSVSFASFSLRNAIHDTVAQSANVGNASPVAQADTGPKYFYFNKISGAIPKVTASAYLVGDLDTGEIILTKNQNQKFPTASVSKLMTALVADEINGGDEVAQVTKRALATYGENGGFRLGEKMKVSDLFYPLLLESSNDAAEILAEHFDREAFVKKMNQEAAILQLSETSYEDPSGLSPKNQSTAYDLFKLAGFIHKEKHELLDITTLRSYSNKKHNWSSNNQFLGDSGYLGGKSGFTDPAKETAVSLFSVPIGENGNRSIAITLLGSKDRYKDVENLLKFVKKNIYYGGVAGANTAWIKQKDGIPEIKDPDFVTLSFLGDIMLDRGVKSSVLKNFGGDYSALFEKMGVLKKSDIVFANLEGPASDKGSDRGNLYSFEMDPSVVPALKGAGISILSVANNHIGDFGHEAFIDTLARLKENEIQYTGGGINRAEAETPAVIEKYGMKIGFLGFTDKGPEWLRAKDDQTGLLSVNDPRFDEIIVNASKQVDYLIVSFHFGEEYEKKHNNRQEKLAHEAIDDGAKIIIGTHPHVMEDTEVYSSKDCTQSSCVGYIAYSLGNFIFDQIFSADTMKGMFLNIKLYRDGSMAVTKNTVRLNDVFQPDTVVLGKEEKIKFPEVKSGALLL